MLTTLALIPLLATPAASQMGVEPVAPDRIFYDWVENGVLKGGFVTVDPANPLMAVPAESEISNERGTFPYVTLVNNGPSANRFDIVFVGDGFTSAELGTYASQVNSVVQAFLAEPPFDAYGSLINIHRVDVVSNESGVDGDPVQGLMKDTALDMGFWCGGLERLLCVDPAKAAAAAASAPGVDAIIALGNSTKYGGAGYPANGLGTACSNNSWTNEIVLHEMGHGMGQLADEYHYGDGATYSGPEPAEVNVSTLDANQMGALQGKWFRWLSDSNIGAFEGAFYNQFGVYRPTSDSKMRSVGRPFEQVNSEQFVFKVYGKVRPIDSATPPGTYSDAEVFFVDPVDPLSHSLVIQWGVDGNPVPGATDLNFAVCGLGLGAGIHSVDVTVTDPTGLVRDENMRGTLLGESRNWTVLVSGSVPPTVISVGGPVYARQPRVVFMTGCSLESVTSVSVGGQAATIVSKTPSRLDFLPAPGDPGFATLSLTAPSGPVVMPGTLKLLPSITVSGGNIGGTVDLDLEDVGPGLFSTFYGLGVLPAPLPVAGAWYGLVLDPFAPWGILEFGVYGGGGEERHGYPVPSDPNLVGIAIHLQAWVQQLFDPFEGQASFTNGTVLVLN